ncbi:hypothetical protein Cyrtocomes_00210 [Candidatus Cyrtobacter comes]|uniref:Uncharacterized protein n=1 Tax=Candidatus Cyrtobacter comes TaxID=675776 RepID=A0ABU5L6U2_9RICK|nr:hypothetical protein [Candidatus Cyrtobacter comes]
MIKIIELGTADQLILGSEGKGMEQNHHKDNHHEGEGKPSDHKCK